MEFSLRNKFFRLIRLFIVTYIAFILFSIIAPYIRTHRTDFNLIDSLKEIPLNSGNSILFQSITSFKWTSVCIYEPYSQLPDGTEVIEGEYALVFKTLESREEKILFLNSLNIESERNCYDSKLLIRTRLERSIFNKEPRLIVTFLSAQDD